MAGHTGIAKTHNLLSCWYYWPKMVNIIQQYIRNCHVCSQAKLARDHQGELLSLPVPQQRWQDLAMDFITDLPKSRDACFPGAKHIWVITDCLTKEHHFVPCAEMTTSHLVWMFIQFVVCTHGLPRSIVSDRGGQFVSLFWKALCAHLDIMLRLSSGHHPETDGQTEQENQELEHYLRSYVNYLQDDWVQWLPLAEFTQNNFQSDSSGMSLFFANKGFHPQLSITPMGEACNQDAMEISGEITQILEQLQAELRLSQEAQAHAANLHQVLSPSYQTGDLVWLNTKNIRTRHPCKKLDDKWIGLFKVLKTGGSRACHLELPHTLKIHPVFHVSFLRLTPANPIPGQSNEHPGPVIGQDTDEEFQVEEILDSKPATS